MARSGSCHVEVDSSCHRLCTPPRMHVAARSEAECVHDVSAVLWWTQKPVGGSEAQGTPRFLNELTARVGLHIWDAPQVLEGSTALAVSASICFLGSLTSSYFGIRGAGRSDALAF